MKREGKFYVPDHLGGHFGWAQMDVGALRKMRDLVDVKTAIDIGAGCGEMVQRMRDMGIQAFGIEGDANQCVEHEHLVHHDYARGSLKWGNVDLAWSVEFLEHVWDKHQANYMATFESAKYAMITAAPPGRGGHHHVNCKPRGYWIRVFEGHGFKHSPELEAEIRKASVPWLLMDIKTRGTNAFDTWMVFESA